MSTLKFTLTLTLDGAIDVPDHASNQEIEQLMKAYLSAHIQTDAHITIETADGTTYPLQGQEKGTSRS